MNLFQIGVDGGGMVPLLPTSTNGPVAVAFDELANEVYWTDVMDKTINSYSLNTRATRWRTVYRDTSGT
jgi:hypothetical protein